MKLKWPGKRTQADQHAAETTQDVYNWALASCVVDVAEEQVVISVTVPTFHPDKSMIHVEADYVCLELFNERGSNSESEAYYRRTIPLKVSVEPDNYTVRHDAGELRITLFRGTGTKEAEEEILPPLAIPTRFPGRSSAIN